jgi:hypothetical protein
MEAESAGGDSPKHEKLGSKKIAARRFFLLDELVAGHRSEKASHGCLCQAGVRGKVCQPRAAIPVRGNFS